MSQFNAFEDAIDFSFWKKLCEDHGELHHFSKGEYFVHTSTILKRVGWIVSGGFKHSLIDDYGNHKAVGFVFENSILANYCSLMMGKEMPTDIIALEDSEVLIIPKKYLYERLMFDPTLHTHFLQALFDQAYSFVLNTYKYSPEQRFQQLITRYPRISDLVTLNDIASYLNISLRHLHRIRKSLQSSSNKQGF